MVVPIDVEVSGNMGIGRFYCQYVTLLAEGVVMQANERLSGYSATFKAV